MATDRCTIIGGPCLVGTCDETYVTQGDVRMEVKPVFRDIENSLLGKVGQKLVDRLITVTFQPIGRPTYAPTLIPLNVADVGSDVMGCTDCFMKIQGSDGKNAELQAVGVLRPPTLNFAPNKSLYGDVTFGAVVANNEDISTPEKVLKLTTGNPFTIPEEACDVAAIIERPASAAWGGAAPFNAMEMTEEGAEITFEYVTEPKKTSANGTVGFRLLEVLARAKLRPANITEAQLFSTMIPVDGSADGVALGAEAVRKDLTLTQIPSAGGLTVLLRDAFVDENGTNLVWGANQNRIGEVTLRSSVSCDGEGALLAPFLITVNP